MVAVCLGGCLLGLSLGLTCLPGGDAPFDPTVPAGNRPPRIIITDIITPSGDNFAQQGEPITVVFSGEDGEDTATVRVFASTSPNPTPADEITIMQGFALGPGAATGTARWNTSDVVVGTYYVFAEIDDRTYDTGDGSGNAPVRVTASDPVTISQAGTAPENGSPTIEMKLPSADAGVSNKDFVTIRFLVKDPNSDTDDIALTYYFDTDRSVANDAVHLFDASLENQTDLDNRTISAVLRQEFLNAGIALSSSASVSVQESGNAWRILDVLRSYTITNIGNRLKVEDVTDAPLVVGTDTVTAGTTAPDQFIQMQLDVEIDLDQLRFRRETDEGGRPLPYYVRVRADDGNGGVVDKYAVGAVRVLASAYDVVDLKGVGGWVAGATWQGFNGFPNDESRGSRAGSAFAALDDLDGDGLDDFAIASRTASPSQRAGVGEVTLVYGRSRWVDPDSPTPQDAQGRYAGVIDLNTAGTIVPFPEDDGRFGRVFYIRGTTMPGQAVWRADDDDDGGGFASGCGSLGVISMVMMPDITGDGVDELLVGSPFVDDVADFEDLDPCDNCTFTDDQSPSLTCFGDPEFTNEPISTDVDDIQPDSGPLDGNTDGWLPLNPANVGPFTQPNVEMDIEGRLLSLATFRVFIEGTVEADEEVHFGPFTARIQLENVNGPYRDVTIVPDPDEGQFGGEGNPVMIIFSVQDSKIGNTDPATDPVPPSVYDGVFNIFLRLPTDYPTGQISIETFRVEVTGLIVQPETHAIQYTYLDGLPPFGIPFPVSNNESCADIEPIPVDLRLIGEQAPADPPMNRSEDVNNRDGQLCDALGVFGRNVGLTNDDPGTPRRPGYRSGIVYVAAGDELVMTTNEEGLYNGDGCQNVGLGNFGQEPRGHGCGESIRGARFRGAWYQPDGRDGALGPMPGPYDPYSLFGYTIDVMPDINTYYGDTELLISSPAGGRYADVMRVDLSDALMGSYVAADGTSRIADFDFAAIPSRVLAAELRISGTAENMPRLRLRVNDVSGAALEATSTEALLWRGAGDDGTIEYDEIFTGPYNFGGIRMEFPLYTMGDAGLLDEVFLGGVGSLTLDILPDGLLADSSAIIDSAILVVEILEANTGYVTVIESRDYTDDDPQTAECNHADIQTGGDQEGGFARPMSWPSTGCDTDGSDPPEREHCFPNETLTLAAELPGDAFGWAHYAGDLDLDGIADIICGAPLSDSYPYPTDGSVDLGLCPPEDEGALIDNGKVYVIYGRRNLGSGLPCEFERFEIRGTHDDDQFGRVQGNAGDVNGDGNDDIFFAAEGYDAVVNTEGVPVTGVDAGFVGVLFGNPTLTGEVAVNAERVGTGNFLGCRFVGGSAGARLGGGGGPRSISCAAGAATLTQPVMERDQYGVSSAGDFNLDGYADLLITAPGQSWPGASVVFGGVVSDGETVTINSVVYEFDTDGSGTEKGHVPVEVPAVTAEMAQIGLLHAMELTSAETLNVASIQSRHQFPAPLPDVPTLTFLARHPGRFDVKTTGANIFVETFARQGVSYLVFGDHSLLNNKVFVLPDDLNRRDARGNRVLRGLVFVSGYERNEGEDDPTPDEAPIEVVARVGDVDGDGFDDIFLGAPEADFINILAPSERRKAAGDAYLIYGNEFGLNKSTAP